MMKKFGLAALVAMVTVFSATVGLAAARASVDGATVINDFGCVIVPADWGGPIPLFTTDTHAVITPSGNSLLSCKFDIPPGLEPDKAFVSDGFTCGTFLGLADNSHAVASPGGNVTLTCQVKHS